jgi:hypothetical protein
VQWVPSIQWCYSFLTEKCQWTLRRVNAKGRVDTPITAIQSRLLEIFFDNLALDIADGASPSLMIAQDEYGIALFPQDKYTYDEKGARHVYMDHSDDKRAITGNIVHSATELVAYQLIFSGKTERTLPSPEARKVLEDKCHMLWGSSENHWSNVEEKKKVIRACVEHREKVIAKWIEDGVKTAAQANEAIMVLILDCWSVNLSDQIRS